MQLSKKQKEINLIFPHQLFQKGELLSSDAPFFLIEENLFFKHYRFHKQKILFHRVSMKNYATYLENRGKKVSYIDSTDKKSDVRILLESLKNEGVNKIQFSKPYDNWLEKRVNKSCAKLDIEIATYPNDYFYNNPEDHLDFFSNKKTYFHNAFYINQRKKNQLLMHQNSPIGGKWSFDAENRKKYPANKKAPLLPNIKPTNIYKESCEYVEKHFSNNPGEISKTPIYPTDFKNSKLWMKDFFESRFSEFGDFEDAIVKKESFLNHSILSPLLNAGLITPRELVEYALSFAKQNNTSINSLEGFIRQIIGWREYVVNIYLIKGSWQRNQNFFGLKRAVPRSFYDGTTGIEPVDATINKLLKSGYSHHIERLMILGNFMLLCEINPNKVYEWFMELYIDAYDWVMVPNIYGMSQFSDGGLMMTKPYISSSNYIKKMSDYKKGDWCDIWDSLYWRFINKYRSFFKTNFRMKFMIQLYDKKTPEQKIKIKELSSNFLSQL